jgi:hypothetical protein
VTNPSECSFSYSPGQRDLLNHGQRQDRESEVRDLNSGRSGYEPRDCVVRFHASWLELRGFPGYLDVEFTQYGTRL